jgi:transposase-like protein
LPRKSYTIEQIISKLREAEVFLSQGQTVGDICRSFNISEQTYYRWRKEYGGIRTESSAPVKGIRERECPAKEAGGRSLTGQLDLNGRRSGETDQPGQMQAKSGARPGSVSGI